MQFHFDLHVFEFQYKIYHQIFGFNFFIEYHVFHQIYLYQIIDQISPNTVPENKATPSVFLNNSSKFKCGSESSSFSKIMIVKISSIILL